VDYTPYLVVAGIFVFAAASFFLRARRVGFVRAGQMAGGPIGGTFSRARQNRSAPAAATVRSSGHHRPGNTLANAAIVALGLGVSAWRGDSLALSVAALLVLILFGCEVLPKTLAVRAPEKWALRVAPPMLLLQSVTRPLQRFVQWMNNRLVQRVLVRSAKPLQTASEEEYRELLETRHTARHASPRAKRNHRRDHRSRSKDRRRQR
jgi:CBS domain containing-hemolysin-like protein